MSLLYMSGFEGAPKGRETPSEGVTYNAGGRTGMCMVLPGTRTCAIAFPTALNEFIVGIAVRPLPGYTGGQAVRITFGDPGERFNVYLQPNGLISVNRQDQYGAATIASAPGVWLPDTYVYLEFHIKSDPTAAGFFRMWADGVKVIDYSGITQNTGNSTPVQMNQVVLSGTSASWDVSTHFDDFYLLDAVDATTTQGKAFNAPLGMPKIEPLALVASGPTNQWVGSDGDSVDNHLLVDESPPSSTDYVESSTPGQRELYDFTAPTLSGDILAVDVSAYASSPDGGANPIKTVVRAADGTTAVGSGIAPPSGTNYKYVTDGLRTKDPSGNAWTKTAVGDATYGVEVG